MRIRREKKEKLKNEIENIVVFVLCLVMFMLLLITVFRWRYFDNERKLCDQSIQGGIKQAGMLMVEDCTDDCLKEMLALPEIAGITCGGVYQPTVSALEGLEKVQQKETVDYIEINESVPWFFMSSYGIDIGNFNLRDGKMPQEWDLQEDEVLLYLGANISPIAIGTRIESESEKCTYIIGGILAPHMNWISDELYICESVIDAQYVENFDDMIVALVPQFMSLRCTYVVKNGYDLQETEDKLLEIASKYNAGIVLRRVSNIVEENQYSATFIILLMATALVLLITLNILGRVQEAALYRDTAFLERLYFTERGQYKLYGICVRKNIFELLSSYVFASAMVYVPLRLLLDNFQSDREVLRKFNAVYFGQAMPLVFGIGVLSCMTVALVVYFKLSEKGRVENQNKIYELQLNLNHSHRKEKEHAMEEFYRVKHDFKHQLLYLHSVIEQEKYEVAKSYMQELLELDQTEHFAEQYSENELIDALLHYKMATAKEYGIDFRVNISVPVDLPFANADLSIILGNTLDNAIEANRIGKMESKYIDLKMKYDSGNLILIVENPYEETIRTNESGKLLTSKKDAYHHGIGLTSVSNILEKYNGDYEIETENDIFKITMIMYGVNNDKNSIM